ncbi:hypothetical protein U9M48_010112 [Paspalum notatum var. saurae]|uniref:NPR1/NIM1-like C-terminal domain-containing protein n=1 Tax=Paspalum notatum var. saurae TaxID=547442 RepID=A0AAQ3WFV7_PASNO
MGSLSFFSSPPLAALVDTDAICLTRLSAHLELLLDPAFLNRADAEIVLAAGDAVGAYSCFLTRSPLLLHHITSLPAGERLRLELAELVPGGRHIRREALLEILLYMYTGRLKFPRQECVDNDCEHKTCRPAIDFFVECMYTASGFQIPELVKLFQRQLSAFVINTDIYEDLIPIVHVASTCQLPDLLDQCIQKISISTLDDKYLALDSDDVDLALKFLNEYTITLDDTFAIHYAAAYCEPKVLKELLKLDSANLDMKNRSGYTPLHIACIRQEPGIIISLVEKGASMLEKTPDGRDALTICKRLTSEKEYNKKLEQGQEGSKAYLCIDILEKELNRTSFACSSISIEETTHRPLVDENFHTRLLNLESRVACANLIFPSEAMHAMRIAEECTGTNFSKLKEVGLNETLTMQIRRLREHLDALTKTVELGRRYFPNCSRRLDKILGDEELTELTLLESGTLEDQQIKRKRFHEIKAEVRKAFNKDVAAGEAIAWTASSPPSPSYEGRGRQHEASRKRKQTETFQ